MKPTALYLWSPSAVIAVMRPQPSTPSVPIFEAPYPRQRRHPHRRGTEYIATPVDTHNVPLLQIDTGQIKQTLYRNLHRDSLRVHADTAPATIKFPNDLPREYYRQLATERLITSRAKSGYLRQTWQQVYHANHALDCMVYAGAAMLLYVDGASRALHAEGKIDDPTRDYGAVIATPDARSASQTPTDDYDESMNNNMRRLTVIAAMLLLITFGCTTLWAQLSKDNDAGDYESAIADFTRALELDPNDANAWHNRGLIYSDIDEPEKAIADYGRAIEINPDDNSVWLTSGRFVLSNRRISESDRRLRSSRSNSIPITPMRGTIGALLTVTRATTNAPSPRVDT